MIEIMDKYCLSESAENLSVYSPPVNKNRSGVNEKMDFSQKMDSSTSSLTSPVDSGVVLLDDYVELPAEIKNLAITEAHVAEIQDVIESTASLNQSDSSTLADPTLDQDISDDEIVFQRKTRKKVMKDNKSKRVSFHEDVSLNDEVVSNKDFKSSSRNSSKTADDFLTEVGQDLNNSLVLSSNFSESTFSIEKMFSKLKNQLLVPLAERGVPEGQEDPFDDSFIESDSTFSFNLKSSARPLEPKHASLLKHSSPRNVLSETPSKAPLVNRFLQSLQMKQYRKKHVPARSKWQRNGLLVNRPLIVKTKLKDIDYKNQINVLNELNDEISVNLCTKNENSWHEEVEQKLKLCIFKDVHINIYKIFQVLSINGEPLLTILTDKSLIIVGVNNNQFTIRFCIQYSNIKVVIVGPNNLTLMFVEQEDSKQSHFTIVTDSENLHGGNDLMSHLEVAALRSKCDSVPVYSTSIHEDRKFLKKTTIEPSEESIYCQWVWLQQSLLTESHPLGPVKEGYAMYRQTKRSKWSPKFILLKAGVIYVFVDSNLKLPIHVIHLQTKQFLGSQKVQDYNQPNAFEILFKPDISVQFGVSSKEELSEWLDAITMSAFCAEDYQVKRTDELDPVIGCCLLVTTKHIVMYQLPYEVLSCLSLRTLNVVKFSSSHSYCILEFDCCEANETNGDWIIHFSSEEALNKFYNVLSTVLPSLNQIMDTIDVTDGFAIRCMERNNSLKNVWDCFL